MNFINCKLSKLFIIFLFCLFSSSFYGVKTGYRKNHNSENKKNLMHDKKKLIYSSTTDLLAEINWTTVKENKSDSKSNFIIWGKDNTGKNYIDIIDTSYKKNKDNKLNQYSLSSLNRSLIFNDHIVGPDISWIVPPGFGWNKKYKFDFTARGHNTRIPDPIKKKFFGWNDGDAVGLFSYQFLHLEKSSFGLNFGVRSLYEGDGSAGGQSAIGEGNSAGFRWDYRLSESSGFAFGAEQLIHFDNTTDSGRNIYITASKAWWSDEYDGHKFFPLYVATAGLATGRMAVGTIKGFCSDLIGSSGTDLVNYPSLCWAPVFSLASVFNEKLSAYFEYNSRFFLLGTSYAPVRNIPLRGNFGLILSDHVDNYKLHSGSEMNWVFNLSLGF